MRCAHATLALARCAPASHLRPKLCVNMRASRATELANQFPSHVAADGLGHTEAIANQHYRQTTEAHFERALSGVEVAPKSAPPSPKNAPNSAPATSGNEGHKEAGKPENSEKKGLLAAPGDLMQVLADKRLGQYWTRTSDPQLVMLVL